MFTKERTGEKLKDQLVPQLDRMYRYRRRRWPSSQWNPVLLTNWVSQYCIVFPYVLACLQQPYFVVSQMTLDYWIICYIQGSAAYSLIYFFHVQFNMVEFRIRLRYSRKRLEFDNLYDIQAIIHLPSPLTPPFQKIILKKKIHKTKSKWELFINNNFMWMKYI